MLSYKSTIFFSCMGYFIQAITVNFAPLLFNTFEKEFGISLSQISLLIAISFATQFIIDFLAAKFSSRINLRLTCILAHACAFVGMIFYAVLPDIFPNAFLGLIIATITASMGSAFIEVVISPIVEACPTKRKSGMMSFLHSFYSWGLAGITLLSTAFFLAFGVENWRMLSILWAIIPFIGGIGFCFVPIYKLEGDTHLEKTPDTKPLHKFPIFWLFLGIMLCAGAAEQTTSQWASSFAEKALGVDKSIGDLLGPFAFAIFMGSARVFYALFSSKIKLRNYMKLSACLCALSFIIIAFSPWPVLSLVGCSVCGFASGIMWPGTYSLAAKKLPYASVSMFAFLAFAGDLGCLIGPSCAGWLSAFFGDDLRVAFLFSALFPILMLLLIKFTNNKNKTLKGKN